jgi:hypothetical protein
MFFTSTLSRPTEEEGIAFQTFLININNRPISVILIARTNVKNYIRNFELLLNKPISFNFVFFLCFIGIK